MSSSYRLSGSTPTHLFQFQTSVTDADSGDITWGHLTGSALWSCLEENKLMSYLVLLGLKMQDVSGGCGWRKDCGIKCYTLQLIRTRKHPFNICWRWIGHLAKWWIAQLLTGQWVSTEGNTILLLTSHLGSCSLKRKLRILIIKKWFQCVTNEQMRYTLFTATAVSTY